MNISNNVIIAFGSILAFVIFMNLITMFFFRGRSGYMPTDKRDNVLDARFLNPAQSRA